jgi:hypothetical protein
MSPVIGFTTKLNNHPGLPPDIFRYAWLEGTVEAKVVYLEHAPDWNKLDTWPAGRIFGDKGEYRWQRNAGKTNTLHTVLILDEGTLPEAFEGMLEITKEMDSPLILWGEWVDPEKDPKGNPDGSPIFYARDIPKAQTYPIQPEKAKEKGKSPCLIVRRYHHESKGEFLRCVCLDMKSENEEEKQ